MELPIIKSKPKVEEPRKMFLFAQSKTGKTSALSQLPNSLLIDLEDGADFYECASINVKRIAKQEGKNMLDVLAEVKTSIVEANQKKGSPVYDFVIIDTTSVLEQIANEFGTSLYKKSAIGKNFFGSDVVTELPQGSGYNWQRMAFDKLYKGFEALAGKCLILSGHVKTSSINKEGKDLAARDIQLTGKLKQMVCSDSDAIGYLYRDKDTDVNIISFKTSEQDLATGSRLPYLSGKDIKLSEIKDGKLVTYWEEIFPSLKVK
jgi:hypothetical protein